MNSQWENYYKALSQHENYMEGLKPDPILYKEQMDYNRAMSEWKMRYHCDAPNKPNYQVANND